MNAFTRPLIGLLLMAAGAAATANQGHKYLESLPDAERNKRLTEMLAEMPGRCVVQHHFFRGFDAQGAAFWSAGCASKEAYAIKILDDANGSTQILNCRLLMERAKVDCFSRL